MTYRSRTITLPRTALPDELAAQSEILTRTFSEHIVTVESTPGHWQVTISRPAAPAFYVDPQIVQGLDWWAPGLTLDRLAESVRRLGIATVSLQDSWGLASLAEWAVRRGELPQEVIYLHADDHGDMTSPLVDVSHRTNIDLITGAPLALSDVASVHSAILSGAIGIGSFLPLFLHAVPKVHFRHLRHLAPVHPGWGHRPRRGSIARHLAPHTLLRPHAMTPAIHVVTSSQGKTEDAVTIIGQYEATDDAQEWLARLPVGVPVLLHVDMDVFNNRYDGNSDWSIEPRGYDPILEEVLLRVDNLISSLCRYVPRDVIELVHIAFSPSFFPVEMWQDTYAQLTNGFKRIGVELPLPGVAHPQHQHEPQQ